ncbi:hypothetical protein D3C73_670190 [compost metagenome]
MLHNIIDIADITAHFTIKNRSIAVGERIISVIIRMEVISSCFTHHHRFGYPIALIFRISLQGLEQGASIPSSYAGQ